MVARADINVERNGKPVLLGPDGKPWRPDGSPEEASGVRFPLPHAWTFVGRIGGAYNTYWHGRYDEALRHAREDAEVMFRDCYLMALLRERRQSVSGLPWHLEIPDENDHRQVLVRDGMTRIIKGISCLRRIFDWLLWAIWYGRYGVEIAWKWDTFVSEPVTKSKEPPMGMGMPMPMGMPMGMPGMGGGNKDEIDKQKRGRVSKCLTIDWALPLNGDKIGYQHDHTPYVLIASDRASYLNKSDIIHTTSGTAMTLRGTWRERFIIHKQDQIDADYFNPEQADAIHGVGARSAIFWLNWIKLEWLGNITDFFDRVGLGFTMWKYPAGNDQAREEAEQAALAQQGRAHILVPVWGEAGREALTGVERVEVPTSGAEALRSLIEYIDKQIERYMVGQEGSSRASPSGLGNDSASQFMQSTKLAITKNDAHFLAETLTGTTREPGLVSIIKKNTYPWADFPVNFVFDIEDVQSNQKLQAARTLVDTGLEVKADEVRSAGGFSKPSKTDEVVESPNAMPPGMPPEGMPPPGMPGEQPGIPGGEESQEQEGDFLDALRMQRGEEEPLRYTWHNAGIVRVSPSGLPLYRWYDPQTRQARIQNVRPGHGRQGRKSKRGPGPGRTKAAMLDVEERTAGLLKQALAVMFPDGWIKLSSLTSLIDAPSEGKVRGGVRRDEDGTLKIGLRHDRIDGPFVLKLAPTGELVVVCPSSDDLADAAVNLATAGFDRVSGGEEEFDYREVPEGVSAPVRKANDKRRHYRRDHADELMAMADSFLPRRGATGVVEEQPETFQREQFSHDYSSTQFNLDGALADKVRALSGKIIDADLAADGREEEPHVTLKYGLHTNDAGDAERIVRGFGPVRFKLGSLSIFPGDEHDVVKIDVEGDDIRRLNKLISDALPNTDKHPVYHPHVTLAYVKPGMGQKYVGQSGLEGYEAIFPSVVFSDKNRQKSQIPLGREDSVPLRHARLLETVRRLKEQGKVELAEEVVIAYARKAGEEVVVS